LDFICARKPVDDDDELKGYILTGLDGEYTLFVASINNVPTTTLNDMCSKLQAYDYRQSTLSKTEQTTTVLQSSTNVDARDGEGEYYRDDREPPRHDGGGYRDGGRYRQDGRDGEQYMCDDYQRRDGGGGIISMILVVDLATMMMVGVTTMMIMVHPRVSWLWKNSYSLC
jgi:hypothetical protein